MKKIISATLILSAIAIAVLVMMNVHHTPTVGDLISNAVDGVYGDVSETVQALKYHFMSH